jgi:hypothetical protein
MESEMRARRWSDNDRYFGPFTFSRDSKHYRPIAVVLASADDEDHGCELRISAFGFTLISALPAIVRPYREKVFPKSWDAATVERLGRDWYYQVDQRKFGFSCSNGFLQIFRGRSTGDSTTDRTSGWFLPWTQFRFIRHSMFDLEGKHFWTQFEASRLGGKGFDEMWTAQEQCPKIVFLFEDFDGERIMATTNIEEREWRFGTGRFKWLSLFRRPRVTRSLNIQFSHETGKRKGSWKGGTVGHSIDMTDASELHAAAFARYCEEHQMKFLGVVDASSDDPAGKQQVRVGDRWYVLGEAAGI